MHRSVEASPSFPALEEEILEWWNANAIQKQALTQREGEAEFVFYEGPPTANAPPPIHSMIPRVFKDLYVRYHSMKGHFVPRKAGWDCHGLPVELQIEKKLGFTHKQQILDHGVERFNELCRAAVVQYVADYERFSERIAFWLDYENAYSTMSDEYIESVWWSLAELHRRDLLYEGDRVTAWCPRCETPLSDHEVAQGYIEVEDPGVTLALPAVGDHTADGVSLAGASLAVWTTTPWTLISNLAAAVHPELSYALVESGKRRLVLAADLVARSLGDSASVVATFPGRALVGLRYQPPFDFARRTLDADDATRDVAESNAWRVLAADFVNTEEGTGVVHLAAAFGADDLAACREARIPTFNPVDARGRFDHRVPDFAGRFVKDADADIVDQLRARDVLLRAEPYRHAYPHCWRCDTPLLYYALTSWYIRTSGFRDRLLEVNAGINWIPEHIRDGRYGNWLENNVDWSLSRYRFWGTPLPIWRCAQRHDTAVSSRAELARLAGRDLSALDLHRPHVDDVTFNCPTCGSDARRVPDLIDVWYDSGAMPFAQYGYPHKDGSGELFKNRFPADFIAEAIDQTRGWFYSLMAEGVLLFDETAYRNVVCHGFLVDAEGRRMSTSRGNVLEPWELFGRYGADALRLFIFSRGSPGDTKRLSLDVLDQVVRGPLLTLWNVYRLYVLYANIDGFDPNSWEPIAPPFRPPLDRWILSELHQLIFEVDEALESYDSLRAARRIVEFVDDLSNWYVRRSRRRFWRSAPDDADRVDKSAAYWTLWTCLVEVSTLLAPFVPFLAESLYRNLVGEVNPSAAPSVHLTDFPQGDPALVNARLASGMAAARELASLGHSARSAAGVKVRQPLGRAVLIVPFDLQDAVEEVATLLAEELNVRELSFAEEIGELVRVTVRPDFPTAGPEFGAQVRALAQALTAFDAAQSAEMASLLEEGREVDVEIGNGETLRVGPEHVEIRREPAEGTAFAYEPPFGVSLDLEISPSLREEGVVREFVHQVQILRRELGLEVTDRIELAVSAPDEIAAALRAYEDYVCEELLATSFTVAELPADAPTVVVDGTEVRVEARKV